MTGDELVQRILQPAEGDDRDQLANDLLKTFFAGYTIASLRALLRSGDVEVQRRGIWIASELGVRGGELLSDVVPLLSSPSRWVRFFSLDCVVTYTRDSDGPAVGQAIALMRDADAGVRAKATSMLMQIPESRLRAALHYFKGRDQQDSELVDGLQSLVGSEFKATDLLRSSSAVVRKFGVAAAARQADWHSGLLEAAASDDPEVSALARRELELRKM